MKRKFDETGSMRDAARSGRPKKTTNDTDLQIIFNHTADPFLPASVTASRINLSKQSVIRRLSAAGLKCHRPAIRSCLSERNRTARIQWAHEHARWSREQWSKVMFTDESSFLIDSKDRRIRCYRKDGERYSDNNILEIQNKGYGCVMVWGAVISGRKSELVRLDGKVNSEIYIQNVLLRHAIPFINTLGEGIIYMHDNAPAHRANRTREFLQVSGINVLEWPAVSPDLNPIEHLWDHMKRVLRTTEPKPRSSDELWAVLLDIWNGINERTIESLTSSMRKRVKCVIDAQGGHTRY